MFLPEMFEQTLADMYELLKDIILEETMLKD
jgi:hypothetical protein